MVKQEKKVINKNGGLWLKISWVILVMLLFLLLIGATVLGWLLYYRVRALPGLMVLGNSVSADSLQQVSNLIEKEISGRDKEIVFTYDGKLRSIKWDDINYKVDISRTTENTLNWGKEWPSILKVLSLTGAKQEIPLVYSVDHELLAKQIEQIKDEIETPALEPEIQISEQKIITSQEGTLGKKINTSELENKISYYLTWLPNEQITLPVEETDLRVGQEVLREAEKRANDWLSKSLTLNFGGNETVWEGAKLAGMIDVKSGFSKTKLTDAGKLLAEDINRPAKDAVFEFDDTTKRVKEFKAEEKGRSLEIDAFVGQVNQRLSSLEKEATDSAQLELPIVETAPQITAASINDLGIKELLGRGESYFKGSIPNRMYNINLAGSRIHGIVVAAGEEFSFNKAVGEVSSATGFKPGYVILNGQTVLGDGGGVCQVSTTVFRAALYSGLPITQWKAHSYRVSYYEQQFFPGFDATVYPPSVDLKFKNDTPGHILVQATVDLDKTYMKVEIFGTSDGRVAQITNPKIWDIVSPADDLYVDDPTLPIGQVKQTEHRINGAKTSFDWKVMRNGEVLHEKTFASAFRAWQAVYLRGTKPL